MYLFLEYDGENGVDKESSVSLTFKDGKLNDIYENGLMKEKIKFTKEQEEQIAKNVENAINKAS
ncbi:hypothetical protein [Lysinibacillus xylanilyticus]|uniref:hypothetical protein n=1 Tax=Lysinibacillus xylanilyticus TaxID=582475 RepID=UPI0036D7B7A2